MYVLTLTLITAHKMSFLKTIVFTALLQPMRTFEHLCFTSTLTNGSGANSLGIAKMFKGILVTPSSYRIVGVVFVFETPLPTTSLILKKLAVS